MIINSTNLDCEKFEEMSEIKELKDLILDMWNFFCVVSDKNHTYSEELDFTVQVWKRMTKLKIITDA